MYGNVDPPGPPLEAQHIAAAGGLTIHVTHGHELGSPTPEKLLARYAGDVIVYGHTHKALVHRHEGRLVVNPGAAGPKRFNAVALGRTPDDYPGAMPRSMSRAR